MSFVKSAISVLSVGALVVNAQMYMWEPETGCGGASCKLVVDAECTSLSTVNEKSHNFDWTHCNEGCMTESDCVGFNFNPSKKINIGGCYFLQGTCSSSIADNTAGVQGVIKGALTKAPTTPTTLAPTLPPPTQAPSSPTVYSCGEQEIIMEKVGKAKVYKCGEPSICFVSKHNSKKAKDWTCEETTTAPSPAPTAPTVYSCEEQEIYVEKVGKAKVYKCGEPSICSVSKHNSKKSKDWTCEETTTAPSPAPTSPTVYSCEGQEINMEKVGKAKVYSCGVDGVCAVASVKNGKKTVQTCVTATPAPSPAPTAPTVYSCSNYEPYMVKEGKAKVYYCGDTDVCDVQATKNGKKLTYACVAKTDAPVTAPTAPTTWSCAVDMEYIKKGKQFRNVCATPDQCEIEKYKDDNGKMQQRCVAV